MTSARRLVPLALAAAVAACGQDARPTGATGGTRPADAAVDAWVAWPDAGEDDRTLEISANRDPSDVLVGEETRLSAVFADPHIASRLPNVVTARATWVVQPRLGELEVDHSADRVTLTFARTGTARVWAEFSDVRSNVLTFTIAPEGWRVVVHRAGAGAGASAQPPRVGATVTLWAELVHSTMTSAKPANVTARPDCAWTAEPRASAELALVEDKLQVTLRQPGPVTVTVTCEGARPGRLAFDGSR